jgi:accessory gene regulator B
MDTYGKCIMTSLGMFVILGTISQYSHQHWSIISLVVLVAISFIVGIAAIIKWAPSDTPNKPITKPEEIRKFKILSVVYCMAWIAAVSIVLFLRMEALLSVKFNVFILSASFGLLLETFTISPAGYRFFDLISGKIRR